VNAIDTRTLTLLLLLLAAPTTSLSALSIDVVGEWSVTLPPISLWDVEEETTIYSAPAQVTLTVRTPDPEERWRVEVRREDLDWSPQLVLEVRRSDDGMGGAPITGGTSFRPISLSDAQLFSGKGNRSNIGLQYAIKGASVALPSGTWSTQVVYTVVEP
jgi:hypothetical protein